MNESSFLISLEELQQALPIEQPEIIKEHFTKLVQRQLSDQTLSDDPTQVLKVIRRILYFFEIKLGVSPVFMRATELICKVGSTSQSLIAQDKWPV